MIKYAGPKPLISKTGIDFDQSKEDKYVYMHIAMQLLKAIDHEYYEDKRYVHNINSPHISEKMLDSEVKQYCKNYEELTDKQNHCVEDEYQNEMQHISENRTLTSVEKEVFENNLKIMHDYLVQRSINKRLYYCVIEHLAEVVKKDNLDYIITPMNQLFVHVLHSVQGVLAKQKFPIDTKMEIYEEDQEFLVKLDVINR